MSTYLRTIAGLVPPTIEEPEEWKTLLVEEGPALDGPWVQIASIELEKEEVPVTASVEGAEDPAYYRILWEATDGDIGEGPVFFLGGATVEWQPSLEQVASLVWARTKVAGGKFTEAGTFTDETRPTAMTATGIIELATNITAGKFTASPCSGNLRESARSHAALYASMLIESSFYPEQTEATGSSFQARLKLWEGSVDSLAELIRVNCGGSEGEEAEPGAALPAGGYDDGLLLIGRDWPPAGDW